MSNLKIDSTSVEAGNNLQTKDLGQSIQESENPRVAKLKAILTQLQGKNICIYQGSQDEPKVLLEKIYANQSQFGKMALWYVNLSWWVKLIHIAVIGLLCCASLALGLVVLSAYTALALLFNDYHSAFIKQNKLIYSITDGVDVYLSAATKNLSDIEDNLTQVLTDLCNTNLAQIDYTESLESYIDVIDQKTQPLLLEVTNNAQVAEKLLISTTIELSELTQEVKEFCNTSNELTTRTIDIAQKNDENLSTIIESFQCDHERLTEVNHALAENVDALNKLTHSLVTFLDKSKYPESNALLNKDALNTETNSILDNLRNRILAQYVRSNRDLQQPASTSTDNIAAYGISNTANRSYSNKKLLLSILQRAIGIVEEAEGVRSSDELALVGFLDAWLKKEECAYVAGEGVLPEFFK